MGWQTQRGRQTEEEGAGMREKEEFGTCQTIVL